MNPERVLVHCVSPVNRRQFNLSVARALDLKQEGADVAVTYCDETAGTCSANLAGNPLTCMNCKSYTKKQLHQLGLKVIAVHQDADQSIELPRSSYKDLKQLATAVVSNLVTQLRIMPRDVDASRLCRLIKKRYFRSAVSLFDDYRKLMAAFKPDRIEVVNGRHGCSKYPILAAQELGVGFNTIEYTLRKLPIIFKGHLPHDRLAFQRRLKSLPADEAIGEKYYSGRRDATYNKFAKQHLQFEPDPRAKTYHRKITFFLSSQDECASLGPEWRSPFPSEPDVIEAACQAHPDIFFCVRFHPHQAGMPGDVAGPFRKLERFSNLRLYLPDSKINTYELVAWSDCVVTFASTVAIESCWMGKPAIQLGPSFYDDLDVSYTPKNVSEFLELLNQDQWQVGDRMNAARFAYFELCDHDEIRHLEVKDRVNRVIGMKPGLRAGLFVSKRVNNAVRDLIKKCYRMAA